MPSVRCAAVSLLLFAALLVCTGCESGSENGVTQMDDQAARQSPHDDCPKGRGFRPLTGLHPPEKIIITTLPKFVDNEAIGRYHVKAAKQLADAIRASGTDAKLVIAGIDPNHVPERMHVLQEPPYDDMVEFMLESTGGRPCLAKLAQRELHVAVDLRSGIADRCRSNQHAPRPAVPCEPKSSFQV